MQDLIVIDKDGMPIVKDAVKAYIAANPGPKGDTGPQGIQGIQGPPNTLAIGTVETGDEAAASITGASPNQTLNLTMPKVDSNVKIYSMSLKSGINNDIKLGGITLRFTGASSNWSATYLSNDNSRHYLQIVWHQIQGTAITNYYKDDHTIQATGSQTLNTGSTFSGTQIIGLIRELSYSISGVWQYGENRVWRINIYVTGGTNYRDCLVIVEEIAEDKIQWLD